MQKLNNKILIIVDQISLSTGGFWTILDIAESLRSKYDIKFCIAGINYLSSIKSFQEIVKKRFSKDLIFVYPILKKRNKKFIFNNFYLLLSSLYKLFLKIALTNKVHDPKEIFKQTNIIFFSSFISIKDLTHINTLLNTKCIKIQNHAGSLKTLENFAENINSSSDFKNKAYFHYLSMQDKILFQSRSQKDHLDTTYPTLKSKSFSFLPSVNEVSLQESKKYGSPFENDKEVFNIVYVGTIQHRKRQELCIDIIQNLQHRKKNVNLYFIGDYQRDDKYYISLKKSIEEKGLKNNIFFTGYIDSFARYMWFCDLIIHPSRAEGVPRVLREALFMGKVIVASNLEGNIDLFKKYNSGILVESSKPESYAEEIIKVIDNENLKLSYEKKARISYDKQLSFKQYKQNVISVFDN